MSHFFIGAWLLLILDVVLAAEPYLLLESHSCQQDGYFIPNHLLLIGSKDAWRGAPFSTEQQLLLGSSLLAPFHNSATNKLLRSEFSPPYLRSKRISLISFMTSDATSFSSPEHRILPSLSLLPAPNFLSPKAPKEPLSPPHLLLMRFLARGRGLPKSDSKSLRSEATS